MISLRPLAITALGGALFVGAMGWSGDLQLGSEGTLVPEAEARIGNPYTPMSYAGVARRTSRRAAYRSAAYNQSYYNANYYAPNCY